jgi:hypothetical protein
MVELGRACCTWLFHDVFTSISNWARLATTLIYLVENQAAVESAKMAGLSVL